MGLSLDIRLSAVTVFLQGLLSFFSPCVLPLLPLYIGYLSGGTADAEGNIRRGRVFRNTVFFVLGVSFAFFLLGLGMQAVGSFFGPNRMLFARIGGAIVILFGLYQLGLFGQSAALEQERRLPLRLEKMAMSPVTALLMGFVFSFAWTPCVGPTLSSVLLLAASADSRAVGFTLIGVYTLGFCIPFLAVGLFTASLMELFRAHRDAVRVSVKVGGVIMVLMGLLMLTGYMNQVTGYLARLSPSAESPAAAETAEEAPDPVPAEEPEEPPVSGEQEPAQTPPASEASEQTPPEEPDGGGELFEIIPAYDFTLKDQYGVTHTLSDYRGKTIFLNFWTTWCPPCRAEMPDIQRLYEKYSAQEDSEVIILGVASPDHNRETDEAGVRAFLEENGYTYPVAMDLTGEVFDTYQVFSLPTTFLIDAEGNFFGYAPGAMDADFMQDAIDQTIASLK